MTEWGRLNASLSQRNGSRLERATQGLDDDWIWVLEDLSRASIVPCLECAG